MVYQIDQSGKIEQTNKDTVLCLSNGTWDTILIKAKTKRQLQEIFRRHGQTRNYVLFVFCAGVSLLFQRNLKISSAVIDREYYRKDSIIKEILLKMLDKKEINILFGNIGRRVNAHNQAYLTYNKKLKPKEIIEATKIFEAIKKTEVGKRLKDA